jgi:hypothetical protein
MACDRFRLILSIESNNLATKLIAGFQEIIGDPEKIREFYSTLIDTIGQIIIQQKDKVLPTVDGLMSYFPQTKDMTKIAAIKDVLECCLQQIEKRQSLSIELSHKELPKISYRVTADFGEVFLLNTKYRNLRSLDSQFSPFIGPNLRN